MRTSILIAAHNEGERLWKTISSCLESSGNVDLEFVVVDDASTDDCISHIEQRFPLEKFPWIRIIRHERRLGVSATKDAAARASTGEVLLFLDGHCKPEPGSIERLSADVLELDGNAVITPRIPMLIAETWKTSKRLVGSGFAMDLKTFDCFWIRKEDLRERGRFYETPAFVGCIAAMSRELYEDLLGFDPDMIDWGVEDLDFSLKTWLQGYSILHDPEAVIAHRFRGEFDNFHVGDDSVIVNKLRTAQKNYPPEVFEEWLRLLERREPADMLEKAMQLYRESSASVERERSRLCERRVHDLYWYVKRFNLPWPIEPL